MGSLKPSHSCVLSRGRSWRQELTSLDHLIMDSDSYFIGLDFAERFNAFAPDIKAGDDMTRVRDRIGAGHDTVTFTADKHLLPSDRGALCWKDPEFKRSIAWSETADGAAINLQNFPNGYTVEASRELDEDWNVENNQCSNALIRDASSTITHNDKVGGWFGGIGEVRVVDHPIGPDQWLTARGEAPEPAKPECGFSDTGRGIGRQVGAEPGAPVPTAIGAPGGRYPRSAI